MDERNFFPIGERKVPDPLMTIKGEKVTSKEMWSNVRRPEIVKLFQQYVYGKPPAESSMTLEFRVLDVQENMMDGKAIRKQIEIHYRGPNGQDKFNILLFVPTTPAEPVPAIIFPNVRGYEYMDPDRKIKKDFWPVEYLIEQGYATAAFQVSEVAPDNLENAYSRAHRVFDQESESDWGTICAWSWGASRVFDYLETDDNINHEKIGIVGHSRGGKTALWAGALDERFDLVVSNNSGSTGAAISRGKIGETIKIINSGFPYWFNDQYKLFNDKEDELPVDQHLLIASIAPRSVYVTSATEDDWADPRSEFLSLIYAKPVYQLFGFEHDKINQFPEPNEPIYDEKIGYHLREGEHDLTLYDWKNVINFWNS